MTSRKGSLVPALAAFVFFGAFLLFSMEPMVGRLLVPAFGSAFHVWSTILMWFQGTLFLAYLYAHYAATTFRKLHPALLLLPLVALPFAPPEASQEFSNGAMLITLTRHFALPFFVLGTTSVVAQKWFAQVTDADPYPLYAASNAGSLLALLCYSFALEPFVAVSTQTSGWAIGFIAYIAIGVFAWHVSRPLSATSVAKADVAANVDARASDEPKAPSAGDYLYWAAVAAAPSALSLAVTNSMLLEIGNAPLVWILPLSLYLTTFIIAFSPRVTLPSMLRRGWPPIAIASFAAAPYLGGLGAAVVELAAFFVIAWVAHDELFQTRPDASRLTQYYLSLSFGGWVGSAFVSLVAPEIFTGLLESHVALIVLAVALAARYRPERLLHRRDAKIVALATVAMLVVAGVSSALRKQGAILARARSHYGVYFVEGIASPEKGEVRRLVNGTTIHGVQMMDQPEAPLAYFHPHGPLGDILSVLAPKQVGVVGLGVGAIAGYPEIDELLFYEIDPVVVQLARDHFSYLSLGDREVEVIEGDARRVIAQEVADGAAPYEMLIIDAFSGDAIPTHLVTLEAIELYLARTERTLVFHISNRYVDLRPVLAAAARELGLSMVVSAKDREVVEDEVGSVWVALSRTPETLAPLRARAFTDPPAPQERTWTDDYASVLRALR